jgi:hypothetical protein
MASASSCGACGVNCGSESCHKVVTGGYTCSCSKHGTNAYCQGVYDSRATCWIAGGSLCQCQCASGSSCAGGCGSGGVCHDVTNSNYCTP